MSKVEIPVNSYFRQPNGSSSYDDPVGQLDQLYNAMYDWELANNRHGEDNVLDRIFDGARRTIRTLRRVYEAMP